MHAPISSWNGFGKWAGGKRFLVSNNDPQQVSWIFDLGERSYEIANNAAAAYSPDVAGLSSNCTVIHKDGTHTLARLDLYSHKEKRVVRSVEKSLTKDSSFWIVGNRYAVTDTPDEIDWLDLEDATETWQSFLVPRGERSWLMRHKDLSVFRRSAFKPLPPGSTQPPTTYTELFRFDDQGNLHLLASWVNSHSGYETLRDASFQDDSIASLDPSGSKIEFRSLADGAKIKSLELDPVVDLLTQKFLMNENYLTVEQRKQYRHYSFKHQRWIESPLETESGWASSALTFSPDSRLALWQGRNNQTAAITDPVNDRMICKIDEPGARFAFLDATTLISIDYWFTLTVRQHDLMTGKTVMTWRPFWWLLPALVIAIFGSAIWVCFWLRLERPNSIWKWVDLHLLLLLLMVLIVFRIRAVGNPVDTSRLPYQHAMYLTAGFLFAAWTWFVLGTESVVIRLSHLLVVYAIVLAPLAIVLDANTELAWLGVACVSAPGMVAVPIVLTARLIRRGWLSIRRNRLRKREPGKPELITLRQILIVTAVFALVSVAIRPMLSGVSGVFQFAQQPRWAIFGIPLVGCLAMFFATTEWILLRRVGHGIALVLFMVLVAEQIMHAVYTGWWQYLFILQYAAVGRSFLGFFCVVLWVCSLLYKNEVEREREEMLEVIDSALPSPFDDKSILVT